MCAIRMNFISSKNVYKVFISKGFTNWLDAGANGSGSDKPFRSASYKEAHKYLYMSLTDACGNIFAQLSTTSNDNRSISQQSLLKIVWSVRFLPRQALPLQGHGSGEDSKFTQLYILREEDKKKVKTWRIEKKATNMCTKRYKMR